MTNKMKKPNRLIEWRYEQAVATCQPCGIFTDEREVKLEPYTTYKEYLEDLQESYEKFCKDNPDINPNEIYVHPVEDDYTGTSYLAFFWLEKESDENYEKRCLAVERQNNFNVKAAKATLKMAIQQDPELAKEILKELGL